MSTSFPTEGGAHSEEGMPASLTFNSFPLHTHEGVQAAWTFIKDPVNADQYEKDEVERFKQRVQEYARQLGVNLR
jgi:hypothetical protein